MLAHERHAEILRVLHELQSVKTTELIRRFDVSFETIRRDLEFLEKEGALARVHGGATLPAAEYRQELPFTVRERKRVPEKQELAAKAAELVAEGQSLFLDVSTTNTEFAKALKQRFERLTLITNSFPIASLVMDKPGFTILFIGGVVRNEEMCVVGGFAEAFVEQFHADAFFMSASGISLTDGVTDYGVGEIQLKKRMMARSKKVVVLADSSKFDAVSLTSVCGLGEIDGVVTDSKLPPETADKYRSAGVEIYM
ncbi:DeoR/GlpR family DNA-binding transcription regulator [Paenibacillus sp.]|uniref:DeoR/GlpR family DNA-binding transcription regulator n=1 Tax=Paenibacillus sp. TaxID=58172 RepID=UPI002811CC91|nr:DeoR/GlpR family DNA-binding transcription regulator [Paenibacillus sp.]